MRKPDWLVAASAEIAALDEKHRFAWKATLGRERGAIYQWRERTIAVPVPDEAGTRLGALLALADCLGAARTLPATA